MATNDDELIAEVRSLTGYGEGSISTADMTDLVAVAKEEILLEIDQPDLDWYNERPAERALFWLVGLFAKIHNREIASAGFSIAELEQTPLRGSEQFWLGQVFRHISHIQNASPFAIRSIARTDRTYEGASSASDTDTDELLG